ncbi:hypothetical protein HO173_006233 [Letharia columbiana]|uniref:Uncharacterized protein n=1 Tax=Letharia columbiana TaxID=112416 RepID=A0A8H6L4R5_9LECA|nr:uncharacterized protein HO173_006233 [Letharia columbiana]KAF6235550.1 hypothetical protein HO173_006233 [Letharia columbiana]
MAEILAQTNKNGVMTAPLVQAILARLDGHSPEPKTMNLCFMAAENVGQFQATRDSDRPHNITVLANQCDIVRYAIV